MPTNNLYLLIGPSGCGKTTLMDGLRKHGFTEAISHTTRACRGPADEGSYHFVDDETFNSMVANGELAEHVTYAGNQYGMSFASLDKGDFAIVELQGVDAFKQLYKNRPIKVIGLAASEPVLASRVLERDGSIDRYEHDKEAFRDFEAYADIVIRSERKEWTLHDTLQYLRDCGENLSER